MPEIGENESHAEHIAASSEQAKNAWQATIEDMEEMAAELEEQGWSTTAIAAEDTAPNPPEAGDPDRYGFIYVIPDNLATEFSDVFERGHEEGGAFQEYEVYKSDLDGRIFQVTVFYDESTASAILIAGTYQLMNAKNLMRAALEHEEMFTHVQTLDQTLLGSFRHEGWEHFFPNAKQRLDG